MPRDNVHEVNAEDAASVKTETIVDPFATDFFAQSVDTAQEEEDVSEAVEALFTAASIEEAAADYDREWYKTLPEVLSSEVRSNNILGQIPVRFAPQISLAVASTLSECVASKNAEADCKAVSFEEANLRTEAELLASEQSVFINFSVEPRRFTGALVLDTAFAIQIIRKGFSDESNTNEKRELTRNELAVLEFFALCCLNETNKLVNQPLFRLRTIEQNLPLWLQSEQTELQSALGLICKIRVQLGETFGMVHLLLPFEVLEGLSESNNPLLLESSRIEKIARFSRVMSDVQVKVVVGETELNASDLAVLERGDVVLVERPAAQFLNQTLKGSVTVRIADEAVASFYGDLLTNKDLRLRIRQINQNSQIKDLTRLNMQEDQLDKPNDSESTSEYDADSLALEKVTVTLSVEIASRRINLEELAGMRVGQIIELGAKPTDSVELVANGRTVAIGELIKIENNLGVRLTRVLL